MLITVAHKATLMFMDPEASILISDIYKCLAYYFFK